MQENWIVPCSVKFFDIVNHFEKNEMIVWKKVSTLREGDIAYIYVGAPYSQIKYRCIITNEDVDTMVLQDNVYAVRPTDKNKRVKYVQMKLEYTYPDGELTLDKLRDHGLGQTQKQARTDRRLQAFIDEVNAELERTQE